MCVCESHKRVCVCVCVGVTYMQQKMVLEDPLHWFEQVGAQGQGVSQRFLTLPEKLGQRLVPHTLCQHSYRPGEKEEREMKWYKGRERGKRERREIRREREER